jgi:micrococcal nuclease
MTLYNYAARLVRCVDGDTVRLDLDLGFFEWRHDQSYRLLRINAPEMSTPEGVEAKVALELFLSGKTLVAHTEKSDHFGRFLADITATDAAGVETNVSDYMVSSGHAVYKTY